MFSPRNKKILEGVAEAFTEAVLLFCKYPTLRYSWMRYLPADTISDEFWSQLWPRIKARLQQLYVLEPFSGKDLKRPGGLRSLVDEMCDASGALLLPDLDEEAYLSKNIAK